MILILVAQIFVELFIVYGQYFLWTLMTVDLAHMKNNGKFALKTDTEWKK